MKIVKLVLLGLALMGMGLSVSADDAVGTVAQGKTKYSCHLVEQRSSEYCQKVMFPAIPFR